MSREELLMKKLGMKLDVLKYQYQYALSQARVKADRAGGGHSQVKGDKYEGLQACFRNVRACNVAKKPVFCAN